MHLRSILAMAVLVGLLGLFVYLRDPAAGEPVRPGRLFTDVAPRDVVAMRVDHLARGYQLVLEHDSQGRWALTDPLAYPADAGTVSLLLNSVVSAVGLPQEVDDLAAVGLDPPRALLEVSWLQAGERAARTIELGALDTDADRVWIRVNGVVQLTPSNLENSLALGVDAFRSKSVADFELRRVLEFQRTGRLESRPGQPEVDLGFDGLREDGVAAWRSRVPAETWLAGESVISFLGALRSLRVADFHDDSLDPLETYSLEEPALCVVLQLTGGETVEWRFAPRYPEEYGEQALVDLSWLCHRVGYPFVWSVDGGAVRILAAGADSFYDYGLARGSRELFERFEVERIPNDGPPLRLSAVRDGETWSLGVGDAEPVPADGARVLDALFAVQSTALLEALPGVAFEHEGEVRRYALQLDESFVWSGRVGRRHTTEEGLDGRLLQRAGDGLVYLAPLELWEALGLERADLESSTAVELVELELASFELHGADRTLRFTRDDRGRWEREDDPGREARELWDKLDVLLSLGVDHWLPGTWLPGSIGASTSGELLDPLELKFEERDGDVVELRLGRLEMSTLPPTSVSVVDAAVRNRVLLEEPERHLHEELLDLLR